VFENKMNVSKLTSKLFLSACIACLSINSIVHAQVKNVRIIVGFVPGGPIDFVARVLSDQLSKEMGTQVIVENKAGSNAGIAAEYVSRATPDGNTLFLTSTGAVAISQSLYDKLNYDPVKDLTPVSLVVNTAEVLVISMSNPANSINEFLENIKQKKGGGALASSGIGSVPHLAMELFVDVTKANLNHVPYKGVSPAITDVIAGHVDGLFIDVPVALGYIKSGKLKALAIAAPQRHPLIPETKTLSEMGLTGVDSNNWYAVYAPKSTPLHEVERVGQAIKRSLESEPLRTKLLSSGVEPAPSSSSALAALQKQDSEKWAKIIRLKNIKGE
jgi:tripartite-type tricarboxylate transporter receptor subunit TctC